MTSTRAITSAARATTQVVAGETITARGRKKQRTKQTQIGRQSAADIVADEPFVSQAVVPEPIPKGKIGALVVLLRRDGGAGIDEMMAVTGWQAHSVRGAIAGAIKKKLGLFVLSEKAEGGRRYRIADAAAS